MCFNAKLKILEHRQQRIAEVRAKYEWLMKELETTKQYLMLDPNKWLSECKARGSFPSPGLPVKTGWHARQGEADTDRVCDCIQGPLSAQSLSGGRWHWRGQPEGGEYCSCEIIPCVSQSRAPANEIFPCVCWKLTHT